MDRSQAAMLVARLAAAFDRELSPEAIEIYVQRLTEFDVRDGDGAYERLLRTELRFPPLAKVYDAFGLVREQRAELERNATPALPEPQRDRRGIPEDVRSLLRKQGLLKPEPAETVGLTKAEKRHRVHLLQETPLPEVCRFCRGESVG